MVTLVCELGRLTTGKGTTEKANDKARYLKRTLSGPKVTIVASVACNEISLASASDVLP